ncbi:hypothetical protein [Streptomyces sp. NPDC001410]|uniref:hypothetical protein n=1 Tax=Streptomyces sp. NPDC001410 TaxID=3364574 RepID=UPI0036C37EA2
MTEKLINPSGIPHFIGDLATLDTDVMLLTADAGQFRASGSDVHTTFQGLSAFYSAPEAEDLFATTLPVQRKSDAFADDLEKVASALSDYSTEVQPLVKKLDALKADATAFVNSVQGDDDWHKDQDKVDHNNDLWYDVNHTVVAFMAAERTAYDKIMALIGGTPLTTDDGSHGENMYGYTAEDLDHAPETPWGAPAEREYEGVAWLVHQGKQVWHGVWDDGVMGTIKGIGTLFGKDGWDEAGEAWKNLAKVSTASGLTGATMGAWWLIPDKNLPSWLRESRTAHNQAVKGLVAWDQWKTNPARAAGATGFNILTAVGTDGAGAAASGAGKAGAAARALSTVGKVGRALDPVTYAGKAGKFAYIRVGDTFTTLKNLHSGATADLLKQADALRPPKIPHDAVPDVDAKGNLIYMVRGGHVYDAEGKLVQHGKDAKVEPSAAERAPSTEAPHHHELVGAGARTPETIAHEGGDLAPRASHEMPGGGGSADGAPRHDSRPSTSSGHAHHTTGSDAHTGHERGVGGPDSGHIHSGEHSNGTLDDGSGDHAGQSDSGSGTGDTPGSGSSGPLELGGEAERRFRDGMRGIPKNNIKPKVLEKIVGRLAENPSGREIAEIISSGHLSHSPGFRDTVSMLGSGRPDQFPRAIDQIRLGDQFYKSGLRNIEFEVKNPGIKADLDVRVTDDTGNSYGYQMKRLNNPKNPFDSIAKPDNLGQLSKSEADHKIMLVDGQGTVAEWQAKGIPEELLQVHLGEHPFKSEKGRGILFVLRLDDGTLVIPPGAKVDPRGVL